MTNTATETFEIFDNGSGWRIYSVMGPDDKVCVYGPTSCIYTALDMRARFERGER
jgi:hypothetical protein